MKKTELQNFFHGKRITVMGLGLLGRGIQVIQFLHKMGAKLLVTDLKTEEQLAPSLKKLAKYKGIKFVLGEHRIQDFTDTDMVIRAPNAPLDSAYLVAARDAKVPIEMDASLFADLCPQGVTIIGVTGTRGKTTTTHLINELLLTAGKRVYMAGNVQGGVTLPLLLKVRAGDFVVLELDSWQLQGFGDKLMSPHIAVFTSFMPDHLNYYRGNMERYFEDKSNIFRFQDETDTLVIHKDIEKRYSVKTSAQVERFSEKTIPDSWKIRMPGLHNRSNAGAALLVARVVGVPDAVSKKVLATFSGVPGRLEELGVIRGVRFVNDTCSTTPDAGIAALKTVAPKAGKKIVLIAGGADKELEYPEWGKAVRKCAKAVILFKGSALSKIETAIGSKKLVKKTGCESMKEAFETAVSLVEKGDTVLLSPAAASFGVFANEYDRGDQFVALYKKLRG